MTRPLHKQGGPPGRKTRQQEIEDWLQGLDLPPEVAKAIREADPRVQVTPTGVPGSFTEMRDLAAQQLYVYFQNSTGVAKSHAFKAIVEMAKLEGDNGGANDEPEPLIADIISGVASLSPIRKRDILTVERDHLQIELGAVEDALAAMDAEAMLV